MRFQIRVVFQIVSRQRGRPKTVTQKEFILHQGYKRGNTTKLRQQTCSVKILLALMDFGLAVPLL